ncbi:MAG: DUF2442 domain-containing protein [Oscillospiraceae bacterium]|jgi:hypothetical protein|nr:DUF2442 domain-containing protein [Oscillospiraceae bacterium]
MNIFDGIVYADKQEKSITVISVRALDEHKLWVRFSTGETKIFDFEPLLDSGVFMVLKDKDLFDDVYIDYGVPVWCNGEIDIAPEKLYYDAVSV